MTITVDQVRQIARLPKSTVLPDINVLNYVNAADVVFAEIPTEYSATWDIAKQDLIKLYLAAHFAVISEEYGGLAQQVVGESEERYQSQSTDLGLASTRFGKTAMLLDNSGKLSSLAAKPIKAQFRVYTNGESICTLSEY